MVRASRSWLCSLLVGLSCRVDDDAPRLDQERVLKCGTRELPCDVSVAGLLVVPERFDGRHVRTQGFLTTGFENEFLYPARESAEYRLIVDQIRIEDISSFALGDDFRGFVTMQGIFRRSERDSGFAQGIIESVTRLESLQRDDEKALIDPSPM